MSLVIPPSERDVHGNSHMPQTKTDRPAHSYGRTRMNGWTDHLASARNNADECCETEPKQSCRLEKQNNERKDTKNAL